MTSLVISMGANLALILVLGYFWVAITQFIKRHDKLIEETSLKEKKYNNLLVAYSEKEIQLITARARVLEAPPVFDQKTKSLLILAVNNSDENEARSAAVQACKRIHKKMNG